MKRGMVLNIQRMSTEDGPGLRTTVFFKGCPLKCIWCHNPESIAFHQELEWFDIRCIHCRTCESACTQHALSFTEERLVIDEEQCTGCMQCVEKCPTNALEAKGKAYDAEVLFTELMKDKAYFGQDGGITLSGGEALAQPEFSASLLKQLKDAGVHTAVDTCGQIPFDVLDRVYEDVSLFLYDIKVFDSEKHQAYTGRDNRLILDNLARLGERIRKDGGTKLWLRTPLIPGATDDDGNIRGISDFIEIHIADVVERWELLAFNNLCASKYQRQNKDWPFEGVKVQDEKKLTHIKSIIKDYNKTADKAYVAQKKVK